VPTRSLTQPSPHGIFKSILLLKRPCSIGESSLSFPDHNISPSALYYRHYFLPLSLGYLKLIKRLVKVIHKGFPFLVRDVEVHMGVVHRAPSILLRTARGPADHLGYQVLEAGWWNFMVRFINVGVGIEARINHDAIDEIFDDCCNVVDTAEPFIERGLWLLGRHPILLSRVSPVDEDGHLLRRVSTQRERSVSGACAG
jgi:hypothetical protein